MQILVILGHPDPTSFNHAIAAATCDALRENGHAVRFHDLYAENFDPLLPKAEIPDGARLPADIEAHCHALKSAEGIVVVHPNWWGQPPAVLKGWVDRVFRPGVAYRFEEGDGGEGIPIGLLKARAAIVFNTANTPDAREQSVFGDPLESLWKRCVFDLCGITTVHRRTFGVIVTSTPQQRQAWLHDVRELVARVYPPAGEKPVRD